MLLLLSLLLAVDQSPGDAGTPLPGSPANPGGPYKTSSEDLRVNLRLQKPVQLYGERDQDDIHRGTRKWANHVRSCYEYSLRRNPGLAGKLSVEFIVPPGGRISGVRLLDVPASLEDEDMRQCLLRTYKKIQFEETEGPVAAFTQQLVFSLR